jgi:hypothetical protein
MMAQVFNDSGTLVVVGITINTDGSITITANDTFDGHVMVLKV